MAQLHPSESGYLYQGGMFQGNYQQGGRQYDEHRHDVQRTNQPVRKPSRRGFAAMDQQRQKEIASKGGKTAHEKGTAHEFTPQEAAEAGRKGGHAAHEKGTAHEFTPQEAAEAGRKGGRASHPGLHEPHEHAGARIWAS